MLLHAANSAATLREPRLALRHGPLRGRDLRPRPVPARPGRAAGSSPRCELRSYVADVKRFDAGRRAPATGAPGGAGATTWVGVLPIGYGDGVRRGLCQQRRGAGRRHAATRSSAPSRWTTSPSTSGPRPEVEPGRRGGADRRPGRRADPRRGVWRERLGTINYEITCGISAPGAARVTAMSAEVADGSAAAPAVQAAREALARRRRLDRRRRGPRRRCSGARGHRPRPRGAARRGGRAAGRSPGPAAPAFQLSDRLRDLAGGRPRRELAGRRRRSCAAKRSRRTSASATSPSTRSRFRSPTAAIRSTRTRGCADLDGAILRAVSERSFADDPLRSCAPPGSAPSSASSSSPRRSSSPAHVGRRGGRARRRAPTSPSCALLLAGPDAAARPRAAGRAGDRPPRCCRSSTALRGVVQNPNHHLDVHGHTLEVLEELLEHRERPRPHRR